MANVKVPALLHKMSKTAQKAWYKKNNMTMPSEVEGGGRSAAAAKRVKVAPRKTSDVKPDSVRAINTARMAAYMAKGGRAPIGAAGSGGNSVMAGSNMSTVRGMITGIKAGFNPKVSLDPYESERAKKTGPRSLKLKKEEAEHVEEGNLANKAKKKEAIRQLGLKAMKAGKVDPARGYIPQRAGREQLKKEETEHVEEGAKEDAEKLLGGPVKTKPKMPPGKQPEGYRYVRALARRAMKAGLKKEEVEQVDEARRMSAAEKLGRAFDSEQQRSALSRQRGLDLLKQKDTEKMQNKLASGNMTKLKKEETEESTMKYIEEKLTAADPASKWISDFVKSDNPKFAGKSKKERIQQALGAYYAKKRGTNEEVEQIDELENKTLLSYVKKARGEGGGNSYLDALTLAPGAREKAEKRTKGLRAVQRALGRNFKAGKAGEEVYEEVEQVDEGRLRRSMRGYAVLGGYGYGNKVRNQSAGERSREINVGLDDKQEKKNARRAAEADKAKMKKEEVEQIDELKKSTLASYVGKAAGRLAASSRLQRDFEKDGHTALAGEFEKSAQKKKVGIQKAANKLAKEEAEGKVAVTPKEKSLAAHHGDKTKITFGDVLKARLKSAAAKKMGK